MSETHNPTVLQGLDALKNIDDLLSMQSSLEVFQQLQPHLFAPSMDHYFYQNAGKEWFPVLFVADQFSAEEIVQHPYRLNHLRKVVSDHPQELVYLLQNLSGLTPTVKWPLMQLLDDFPTPLLSQLLPTLEHLMFQETELLVVMPFSNLVIKFLQEDPASPHGRFLLKLLFQVWIEEKDSGYYRADVHSHFDGWHSQDFYNRNKALLQSLPYFPRLIAEQLASISQHEVIRRGMELKFTLGRAWIHQSSSYSAHEVEEVLLDIMVDLCNTYKDQPVAAQNLLELLQEYPYEVFKRLFYYLLSETADPEVTLLGRALVDQAVFTSAQPREYRLALERHFHKLPAEQQETIKSWVRVNPLRLKWEQVLRRQGNGSADELEERLASWTNRMLYQFGTALPEEFTSLRDSLQARFGEPSAFGVHFEEVPPVEATFDEETLSRWSVDQLIQVLNSPAPATESRWDRLEKRVEGVAKSIRLDVMRRPEFYFHHLQTFRHITDVEYKAAIASQLMETLKGKHPEEVLANLMDIMRFVESQTQVYRVEEGWSWVLNRICDQLSEEVFGQTEVLISQDSMGTLWEHLKRMFASADPQTEIVKPYQGADALTASLNCTRGKATHTALRLVGWISDVRVNSATTEYDLLLEDMQGFLLNRLSEDPSSAVWAAYVPALRWIAYHHQAWFEQLAHRLFDRTRPELSSHVWKTYLHWCRYYNRLFDHLRPLYLAYIQEDVLHPERALWGTDKEVVQEVAEHLMVFYGRGRIDFGSSDGLLEQGFALLPSNALHEGLQQIGRMLNNTKEDFTPEMLARFQRLWEHAALVARERKMPSILVAFEIWFASRKFDDPWALGHLRTLAASTRMEHFDLWVFEPLLDMLPSMPLQVLEVFQLFLQNGHHYYYQIREWNKVFDRLEDTRSPEVDAAVNQLVNSLVEKGFIAEFRRYQRN